MRLFERIVRMASAPCLAAALVLSTGCASYVNIPAQDGDTAVHAVNFAPVPSLMADAVGYAVNAFPVEGSFAIELPAGSNAATYAKSLAQAPDGVRISDDSAGLPLYEVTRVQIRGSDAIVQVMLPQAPDRRRLLEVGFDGRVSGWKIVNAARWYPPTMMESIDLDAAPTDEVDAFGSDEPETEGAGGDSPSIEEVPAGSSGGGDSSGSRSITPISPARGSGDSG
ncbi:MAG: hypothetical protein ACF8PN_01895 [Phycisphaerales bacterium]